LPLALSLAILSLPHPTSFLLAAFGTAIAAFATWTRPPASSEKHDFQSEGPD
jgi:hypothetical protein